MNLTPTVYTLQDLKDWEHRAALISPPIRLAVLGDPVAHSASPQMHNAALQHHNLPFSYVRLHIRPEELSEAIPLLRSRNFIGVNLTIPHKAAILPLIDSIDPSAQFLGVANTVAFREKTSIAFNTDGGGLTRAVKADFGVHLGALKTIVLGAGGGAGRAIAIQCVLECCPQITLVNRTFEKAHRLALELDTLARKAHPANPPTIQIATLDSASLREVADSAQLLIQCTSLGMKPDDASPFPRDLLRKTHLVYDTIYSHPTRLLADAQEIGARVANGLSMLLHQGALAFEIWFENKQAPISLMEAALRKPVSH